MSLPLGKIGGGVGDDLVSVGEVVTKDVEGEDIFGELFDDLGVAGVVVGVLEEVC